MLKGEESVKNYADVLAKIRYYNTRAESYNKRLYTVHCAMLGAKVLSNEFFVQVSYFLPNLNCLTKYFVKLL